jgi:phage major head subunit gpT-like protein
MENSFKARPTFYDKITTVKTSKRAYEESAYYASLGLFPEKPEGEAIAYDEFIQGPTKRWYHKTYGMGIRVTEEMIEDSLYPDVPTEMGDMSKALGRSAAETLEILCHDVLNGSTKTAGDGVAVFATTHVRLGGGTWSNLASTPASLSAASLRQAILDLENTTNDRGLQQVIKPSKLVVPPALEWTARELLNSAYDPESANNSVNPLQSRNLELVVDPFLTSSTAWFVFGDQSPIITFKRRAPEFKQDTDFQTGDWLAKSTFRMSCEVNSPLGMYKNAGA